MQSQCALAAISTSSPHNVLVATDCEGAETSHEAVVLSIDDVDFDSLMKSKVQTTGQPRSCRLPAECRLRLQVHGVEHTECVLILAFGNEEPPHAACTPYRICTGTGLTPTTSAPGLGSPVPQLHWV